MRAIFAAVLLAGTGHAFAPPPMVTGDVPTADREASELYTGLRYQESESARPARQLPFTELVYGITDRQELTFEIAYLSRDHEHGFGDAVVGTKYVFLKEDEQRPGIAGSFELKLPTGSERRGLGTGEFDYDLRLRAQKTWAWFTAIANAGYTFACLKNGARLCRRPAAAGETLRIAKKLKTAAAGRGRHSRAPAFLKHAL